MEHIPIDVDAAIAERPDEDPRTRQERLKNAMRVAVSVHRDNLSGFKPASIPGVGHDAFLDEGRNAIWSLDTHLIELEERGWR